MKFIGRRDLVLLAGLGLTLAVVFLEPVHRVLDVAQDMERSSGLALIPGLFILSVFFLFHQMSKRQEEKTHAKAAQAEALESEARAAEMERLVVFGQALGRSLDLDAIRDVVGQHLTRLTASEEGWVMTRADGKWSALIGTARESRDELERTHQYIADVALLGVTADSPKPISASGHLCTPMVGGGGVLGVLGVPETAGPFTEGRRRVLTAAATLLAVSLRNAELFREVRENGLRDGLTGCFNRTHAIDVLDTELRRARRSHAPVSVIMFDLDHFKDINDHHGHLCGDAVLAAVGNRMRDVLRGSDLKCRYGGEEFLVVLPETPLEGAKRVADTLRRELAEMKIDWKKETIRITASFGVSVAQPGEIDAQSIIGRADAALYQAKDQGRNCVRVLAASAVA
ncbi:MAG TPA: GGDEF domain-containing protein [Vicinamibacterales bacterium]|jgi:diguanylate cyclase (GGDEF)-like protein|nr:GGDEF domain-containing protein [Vicinamibacterales bacterium]